MLQVLLVIHIILAVTLVGAVLLQRSEGGALGMGGGTMGGLMTTRGSANFLTRLTAGVAACFIATSLLLAIMSSTNRAPTSILDKSTTAPVQQQAPASAPKAPSVPVAK